MKKLLDLIEQKVQWIVLGIGVLWVMYMAWTYLINPPVKVEGMGEQALGPSEVDDYIERTVVADFNNKKTGKGAAPPAAPELLAKFDEKLNFIGAAPEKWDNAQVVLGPTKSIDIDLKPPGIGDPKVPVPPNQDPVKFVAGQMTQEPDLTAPKLASTRDGKTSVLPVAANQGQAVGVTAVDKFWVTVRDEIDMAAMAKAFTDVKVPDAPQPANTTFLRILVEREQLMPDGSWSNRTVVPPLATQMMEPLPAANAPAAACWPYLTWATQHPADILQPAFFQYVKGDVWAPPGEPLPDAQQEQQFDPNQFVDWTPEQINARVPKFTSQQLQQIYKARQDKKKQEAAGQRGSRQPTPRPGAAPGRTPGGMPAGPDFGPNDPVRPGGMAPPTNFPGYRPIPGGNMPEGEGFMPEGTQQQTNANFPIPPGEFSPQAYVAQNPANSTLVSWAHDDTVQPGQTYRYRVAYVIKNPVFQMAHFCKDPKLADKFSFQSKFSEWSDKVEVLPIISFWVKNAPMDKATEVLFQVFRWQSGDTKTTDVKVAPGDPISKREGDIDFVTGWTLVDMGKDAKGTFYTLLMDPAGGIHRRDGSETNNERYKKLRDQAAAGSTSASAAGG